MSQTNKHGNIVLPTITACALWDCEVTGQLSDGTWENSSPHDHWKFWSRLVPCCDDTATPHVEVDSWARPKRTKYNIVNLMNSKWDKEDVERLGDGDRYILRGRMLKQARMALAFQKLARPVDFAVCRSAEYMPAKPYQFRACKQANVWEHDFVAKYMEPVDLELAQAFYEAEYGASELKRDLLSVRSAMEAPVVQRESQTKTQPTLAAGTV